MNGHENCKIVVFSNKAYNAIVNETFRKDPVETGGILLGHVLSNGYWIVMEVIPPGLKAIHQMAYFEYDTEFVNYMANSVSKQYKMELDVLGLWHRHPGSMDFFSGTDDGTNKTFAQMNSYGAISGLVNIDPKFRFTLRHVAYPLDYQIVEVEVGDDLIPEQYFELKYSFGDNLSPTIPTGDNRSSDTHIAEPERDDGCEEPESTSQGGQSNGRKGIDHSEILEQKPVPQNKKKYLYVLVPLLCLLVGVFVGRFNGNKGEVDDVMTASITKLQAENDNLKRQNREQTDSIEKLSNELNEAKDQAKALGHDKDAEVKAWQNEKENLQSQINTLTTTNGKLSSTIDALQKQIDALQKQIEKLNQANTKMDTINKE